MDTDTASCDVVIPYRKVTPDTELFFALKSWKNIPHRNIWIVGDKPDWYKGNHIPITEYKWNIHIPIHNQENKIRAACEHPDISDDFILSNDDFFIMKPTQLKLFNRGTLQQHISERQRRDQYQRSLQQTLEILHRQDIAEPLSFDLHIPMLLNKQKRLELSYAMEPKLNRGYMPLFRSLYGNLYPEPSEYMVDVKNIGNFTDSVYLSTSDKTFKTDIGDYIKSVLQWS